MGGGQEPTPALKTPWRWQPRAPPAARHRSKRPPPAAAARERAQKWQRAHAVSYTHLTLPTICSV
eukprot:6831421-Alexandrium_andersonii.AAC.1